MKNILAPLAAAVLCSTMVAHAATKINIDGFEQLHPVHSMIQGQGLVYSIEADHIYADGSMSDLYRDVGAGFLRWPGGTVTSMYHWDRLNGVGWVDSWNPNYSRTQDAYPSEYMDLDEYIALARASGVEPMLGINMSSGMEWNRQQDGVQEAKNLIEYCLQKGFDVKYYYLDNESYHHGNNYNKDVDNDNEHWSPTSYANQFNIYAEAIRSLVPDAVLIANWSDKIRTTKSAYEKIINIAGRNIDYMDVHWYWKWNHATWDAWKAKTPMEYETDWYNGGTFIEEIEFFNNLTKSLGYPHIKLAALEWNIGPGDHNVNPVHTPYMTALMASEMQMQFIQGGLELAALWTTQWHNSSTDRFQFLVNSDNNYLPGPMANVFKLYKHALNGDVLQTTTNDNEIVSTAIIKGDKAYVYVLNKKDKIENGEFLINGYDITSVESAQRFSDPGDLSNISLWTHSTSGNYMATLKPNTLTLVEFNIEPSLQNAINNSDFENGLTAWNTWNAPQVQSNDVYSGAKAIEISDKGSLNQWVSVLPNTKYELTAVMKISNANERVVLGVDDEYGSKIASKSISDSRYTEHKVIFDTLADQTLVKVYAWLPPSNGASAHVDMMTLKPFTASITNGGFETGLTNWNTWNKPQVQSSDVFSGTKTVKLHDKGSLNQLVAVLPNTKYELTAVMKISDDNEHIVLGVNGENGTKIANKSINDTRYTEHKVVFTTDADQNVVKVYAWLPPSNGATAYVDAMAIKPYAVSIANGGFETGLTNWNAWKSVSINTTDSKSGNQAIQLNGNAAVNQVFDVEPNKTYTITAHVKVDDPLSSPVVLGANDTSDNSPLELVYIESQVYEQVKLSIKTGENTTAVKVFFWRPKGGQNQAYMDDISIIEVLSD